MSVEGHDSSKSVARSVGSHLQARYRIYIPCSEKIAFIGIIRRGISYGVTGTLAKRAETAGWFGERKANHFTSDDRFPALTGRLKSPAVIRTACCGGSRWGWGRRVSGGHTAGIVRDADHDSGAVSCSPSPPAPTKWTSPLGIICAALKIFPTSLWREKSGTHLCWRDIHDEDGGLHVNHLYIAPVHGG